MIASMLLSGIFGIATRKIGIAYAEIKKRILPKNTEPSRLHQENPEYLDTRNLRTMPVEDFGTMGDTDQTVNLESWRLEIIDSEKTLLKLSYDDLLAMPALHKKVLLICPGFFSYHAKWTGVSIRELMKRAGCESMCYGIDSGSKKTLSFIRKKIDIGILYKRVVETADQGIIPTLSFVIGFPEEEEKDIDETLVLALRAGIVGNNNPLIQLPTVLPGTDLHSRYMDRLVREVDTYFAMGLEFDRGSRLQSDDTVGGRTKRDVLFFVRMGGVVGGDRINRTIRQPFANGLPVGFSAQRGIHFRMGTTVINRRICYGKIMRGRFRGNLHTPCLGTTDGTHRFGRADMGDMNRCCGQLITRLCLALQSEPALTAEVATGKKKSECLPWTLI